MRRIRIAWFVGLVIALGPAGGAAQTNPLWDAQKVTNYLPHMTVPEVRDFLTRSDMVLLPVAALEQHGNHLPIGTDYLNGVEQAKLIAQQVDVLVAPILLPGQSPYHMGFEGTITLPSTLIQEVYVEAAKSLLAHGFKRFLIMNGTAGTGRSRRSSWTASIRRPPESPSTSVPSRPRSWIARGPPVSHPRPRNSIDTGARRRRRARSTSCPRSSISTPRCPRTFPCPITSKRCSPRC